MAEVNRQWKLIANGKTVVSSSSVKLDYTDFSGTDTLLVFPIPEQSLLTQAFVVPSSVGQNNLKFDVLYNSTEIVSDADVAQATVTQKDLKVHSKLGGVVKIRPSAAPTKGTFVVIVQYVEYTLSAGTSGA